MADIRVQDEWSIALVLPESDAAVEWIEEHVSRDGYQPLWPTLVVEPRYLDDLLFGMHLDGLEVAGAIGS